MHIVIDFVHVLEKLWAAAWCLHPPAAPAAEDWVATHALTLLAGHTDQVLEAGWPIATGVIEGACRHLIADRFDLARARWGLAGAEAVLKLRALIAKGHLDDYWSYHLAPQRDRVHQARCQDGYAITV